MQSMASIPMPRRMTPMQPMTNLVLVSRVQEWKRRMTQESLLLPLACQQSLHNNTISVISVVTVNPCMNMSVPYPLQNLSSDWDLSWVCGR